MTVLLKTFVENIVFSLSFKIYLLINKKYFFTIFGFTLVYSNIDTKLVMYKSITFQVSLGLVSLDWVRLG